MAESRAHNEQFVPGRNKFCEPCQKLTKQTLAKVYCKQCGQFQCDECEKAHEQFEFMSGHEIVYADNASEIKETLWEHVKPSVNLDGLDVCGRHKKVFEFYCVDHATLLCSSCTMEKHRQCREVNELSTQIKRSKFDPGYVISALNNIRARASSVIEHVSTTTMSVKAQVSDIPIQIDNMKAEIIQKFDASKCKIVKEASQNEINLIQGLKDTETKCDKISKIANEHIITVKNVCERGSPEQIFIVTNVLSSLIEQYSCNIDRVEKDKYDVSFTLNVNQVLNPILNKELTIGDLVVNQRKSSACVQDASLYVYLKPARFVSITGIDVKKIGNDDTEPQYTGMAFLPDERIVAIYNFNFRCYTMNTRLENLGIYQFQFAPKTVSVISATEVAISGGARNGKILHILTISPDHKISLMRTIKCSSYYLSLYLMNDDTLIASTYNDKRPVRMISVSGRESDLDGLPEKQYDIGQSSSTYLRNEDVLVFIERFEHAVYIYDIDGNKCALRSVVKHEDIKEPLGVCPGPGETIFVCSMNTHSVVQLSLTGKVLSSIKVDMMYPRTVCVNQEKTKVMVSNCCKENLKLQLYSIK